MPTPDDRVHRDAMEAVITHCWESALRRDRLGAHDNFFALGGHSLVAIRIANRLRGALDVPVSAGLLLEHPTIAELAQSLRDSGVPAAQLDDASRRYARAHGLPVPAAASEPSPESAQ